MKLSRLALGMAVAIAASAHSAKANIVVNGSASFQPVGAMSQSGPAYWANSSSDGSQANIGYFLNSSGYYASNFNVTSPAIAGADMEYWAQGSGAADSNVTFTASGRVHLELLLTLAGDYAINEFGWYSAGDPTSKVTLFKNGFDAGDGTQSLVFGNNASYGTIPLAATFQPGGDFGFYLTNGLGETFFTESSLNTSGSLQQFAFLRSITDPSGSILYIGGEDRRNGDFDYNDYVIRMRSVVPEPSSIALVGAAMIVFGAHRVRTMRRKTA